ncbi:inositol monophosphatase family protein [Chitinibacteraceae bacterium HSL-7]
MQISAHQLDVMHQLARISGEVIRSYFRTPLAIDDKTDDSPVTQADREAERVMRAKLAELCPKDGIIGEEFGAQREDAEWVWVLDPVDGTKSFTVGRPLFVTLIGLLHRGVPVLGAVHQPISGELWLGGMGVPTTLNGVAVRTSSVDELAGCRIGTTGPDYLDVAADAFADIASRCRFPIYGGDGYQYVQVASGWLEIVIEEGLKLHDFAALAPVVNSAGGVMTDWHGNVLTMSSRGNVVAAANPQLHRQLLTQLAELPL